MDKPFRTHDELIKLLKSRGLSTDRHTKFILEREGYYAVVNGYKDLFLDKEKSKKYGHECYKKDSEFSEIYSLFVMDRHMRTSLFRYITLAEATLKSISIYEFCSQNREDNEAYLKQKNYRKEKRYSVLIERFIKELNRIIGRSDKSPKYNKEYLEHYINNHDNIPLWVVMNNLSLGQAFKFYDFQNESVRFHIAQRFQKLYNETHYENKRITHKDIYNAYNNIKEFRNICAHDERIFCARVGKSKSASFSDVLDNLQIVLTGNQYKTLLHEIMNNLIEASSGIHTVGLFDILPLMGFESLNDLAVIEK